MAKQPDSWNRRASKVHPVPIGKMRIPPALVTQRPFRKAHGDDLAANLDLWKRRAACVLRHQRRVLPVRTRLAMSRPRSLLAAI